MIEHPLFAISGSSPARPDVARAPLLSIWRSSSACPTLRATRYAGCARVLCHRLFDTNRRYFPQYHPPANIEKMASGTPLTDADRWDWLIALRDQSLTELQQGATGVVLTCSALKKKYRDVIRIASYNDHAVRVHFVYLRASQELLLQRVKARQGHYMKDSMVKSQFSSLEEPRSDETDCLILDVSRTLLDVQSLALDAVKRALLDDDIHDT